MKILFASSEAHPLIKTGGLGDVAGSLPLALRDENVDARLILPAYPAALAKVDNAQVIARLDLPGSVGPTELLKATFPDSDMPLYLVRSEHYFDRPGGPYSHPDGYDWPDNAQRFALFARAVVDLAQNRVGIDWQPDIVHCNDWQTGLVPALLSLEAKRPATIYTIHNLAYMGLYGWDTFATLSLPGHFWSMDGMEFHNNISFLKGGIVYADWVTTVSPTYSWEIRTPEFGYGLEGLLNYRKDRLVGILNGVDYDVWDPAVDPLIPANYSPEDLSGKTQCKLALQRHFGLPEDPHIPVLGNVGRMVDQKGLDLLIEALPQLTHRDMQVVVLGSGEAWMEDALSQLAAHFPARIKVQIGYDESLAHLIEAGSDMFLMPSRFEPCGLNQIYSLRYGTLPIVHETGGLADTVVDTTQHHLMHNQATGFLFTETTAEALRVAVDRALDLYDQTEIWRGSLMQQAMSRDFSWQRSAEDYMELYIRALK